MVAWYVIYIYITPFYFSQKSETLLNIKHQHQIKHKQSEDDFYQGRHPTKN